jgi:protein gp37
MGSGQIAVLVERLALALERVAKCLEQQRATWAGALRGCSVGFRYKAAREGLNRRSNSMPENSKIGWTRHTMNFWWGCNKVTRECRNCYIGPIMERAGQVPFGGPMRTKHWSNPAKWNRRARVTGVRERVFTCSMSDFFHPGADAWRPEAWDIIKACENLDWLILTKRPELAADRLPADWGQGYPNVWLGVTCGSSDSLHFLDDLRQLPAALKFVSAEPLLERVDFRPYLSWLDWVITGCERAAKGKRQVMDLAWVRDIDRQCQEAGVPHFFKQAYQDEKGVPCEEPPLDGEVVQEVPCQTRRISLHVVAGQ